MPLFETVSLTLGAAIAKEIIKSCLGENWSDVCGELIELLKNRTERALAQGETARRIAKIGEQVALKLRPVFESERFRFSAAKFAVVTQEVALTLAKTPIDSRLVLDYRFDIDRLARHLISSRPEITQTFSADEATVYERMLRQVCTEITGIASELSSFERHLAEAILQNQDQILELVETIYSRPNKDADAFERLYCRAVATQLDHTELFGVVRMDAATRRQSLSIAYVAIDVDQTGNQGQQTQLFDKAIVDDPTGDDFAKGVRRAPQSGPIDQLLATSRRIIVRGQAGSGKSTLLQWIAVRSANQDFPAHLSPWNNTVPFFYPLA
ncbi:MAG: hypothetical protein DKINENOH_04137 [bacterium]|nr:hypothetical protein [bacterium]